MLLFNDYFLTVHDVQAACRLTDALTAQVVDSTVLSTSLFNLGNACGLITKQEAECAGCVWSGYVFCQQVSLACGNFTLSSHQMEQTTLQDVSLVSLNRSSRNSSLQQVYVLKSSICLYRNRIRSTTFTLQDNTAIGRQFIDLGQFHGSFCDFCYDVCSGQTFCISEIEAISGSQCRVAAIGDSASNRTNWCININSFKSLLFTCVSISANGYRIADFCFILFILNIHILDNDIFWHRSQANSKVSTTSGNELNAFT